MIEYIDEKEPLDCKIDGKMFVILAHARKHLEKIFIDKFGGKSWPLEGYEILVNLYPERNYAAVAFCPKIEDVIDGVPFEVPDRGIWKNGPGVHIFLSLSNFENLKTLFMR